MAKISRYELGRTGYALDEVAKLLDHYQVKEPRRAKLLALAEDANQHGWWGEYDDTNPPEYQEYIGLEAEAESVVGWYITGFPGLLQTEDYARELNSFFKSVVTVPPALMERRVEVRMRRRQVLTERNPPLELSVILDESALQRPIGGQRVMRAQLRYLAAAAEWPNVHLRVLPLVSGIAPPPAPFQVFGFSAEDGTSKLGDVVSIESLTRNLLVEGETDTYLYRLLYNRLEELSLPPEESSQLILRTADRLERND